MRKRNSFRGIPAAQRRVEFDCDAVLYERKFEKLLQRRIWGALIAHQIGRRADDAIWATFKPELSTPGAWPTHLEGVQKVLRTQYGCVVDAVALRADLVAAIEAHTGTIEDFGPQAHILDILRAYEYGGVRRGVVTSALRPYTDRVLRLIGLDRFFVPEQVVTAEDVETCQASRGVPHSFKPGPWPWLLNLDRLGGHRDMHVEVFEDNPWNGLLAVASLPNARGWIITRDGNSVATTIAGMRARPFATHEQAVAEYIGGVMGRTLRVGDVVPGQVFDRIHVATTFQAASHVIRGELQAVA